MVSNIMSERKRIGLDQKDLAEKLNVSISTVSRWERGLLYPYGAELIAMRDLFGCSTDYLLGVSNERNHIRV